MRAGAAALQPAHPLCRVMAPLHPSPPPTPENNPADYRCRRFDVALYVSWAHLIELLGHTEMTWTPVGHWMRAIPDLLGLSLQVRQRGPNHRTPLPHRCSAFILPSGLLPHSCGRRAFTPQLLRSCGAHGTRRRFLPPTLHRFRTTPCTTRSPSPISQSGSSYSTFSSAHTNRRTARAPARSLPLSCRISWGRWSFRAAMTHQRRQRTISSLFRPALSTRTAAAARLQGNPKRHILHLAMPASRALSDRAIRSLV